MINSFTYSPPLIPWYQAFDHLVHFEQLYLFWKQGLFCTLGSGKYLISTPGETWARYWSKKVKNYAEGQIMRLSRHKLWSVIMSCYTKPEPWSPNRALHTRQNWKIIVKKLIRLADFLLKHVYEASQIRLIGHGYHDHETMHAKRFAHTYNIFIDTSSERCKLAMIYKRLSYKILYTLDIITFFDTICRFQMQRSKGEN